jgi:lysine-specific demethylase 8
MEGSESTAALLAARAGGGRPASTRRGGGDEPRVHAWLGPAGTVSCLHWDAPHNLLSQVVGFKRVRIYAPEYGARLYPHEGLMANTARVDPEADDGGGGEGAFPLFPGTPCWEAVLGPGDTLYIPPRFWHHVRALTTSFSVSFWWG